MFVVLLLPVMPNNGDVGKFTLFYLCPNILKANCCED